MLFHPPGVKTIFVVYEKQFYHYESQKMKTKVLIRSNQFSVQEKEAMWGIYQHYYRYSKAYFMERLGQQDQFVLLKHGDQLVGFTGMKIRKVKIAGKWRRLIYFGQAVLHPSARGKSLLSAAAFLLCWKYWQDLLLGRICFWCDALSYKSYLLFAKSVESYYPSYQQQTPPAIDAVIQYIGESHYTDSFCRQTGTVQKPQNYLDDPTVLVCPQDLADPDISYYIRQNPGYQKGNGLITVAPITYKDLYMLAGRFLRKGWQKRRTKIQQIPARREQVPAA